MKYLVTGGAGFVGSHLCDLLIAQGHHVVALDDLRTGNLANVAQLAGHPRFELVQTSVEESPLAELVEAADVVFHLAATVGVFNVADRTSEAIENNIETTAEVLRAAAAGGTKVVIASTSEVYGKATAPAFAEDGDVVLGPTSKARWSYAASKMIDEFLGLAYWREFGVPVVIVRLFNTIGPRQVGHYGMVVPRFLLQALRNEAVTVYGTGQQSRCFTYVSDATHWLSLLAQDDRAVGGVFNLGNPSEISILDLARKVIQVTGSSSEVDFIPYDEAYDVGFEDIQRRVPDIGKVVGLTGYAPRVDLDEALRRTRDWLVEAEALDRSPLPAARQHSA